MRKHVNKFANVLSNPSNTRTISLIILLLIIAMIPLTVIVSQQRQDIRQRAEGFSCPYTDDGQGSGGTCTGSGRGSCRAWEVCISGFCHAQDTCGCSQPSDCIPGHYCDSGVCSSSPPSGTENCGLGVSCQGSNPSDCSRCIIDTAHKIDLNFYSSAHWSTDSQNYNNIINNWCNSADPASCQTSKNSATCAASCGGTVPTSNPSPTSTPAPNPMTASITGPASITRGTNATYTASTSDSRVHTFLFYYGLDDSLISGNSWHQFGTCHTNPCTASFDPSELPAGRNSTVIQVTAAASSADDPYHDGTDKNTENLCSGNPKLPLGQIPSWAGGFCGANSNITATVSDAACTDNCSQRTQICQGITFNDACGNSCQGTKDCTTPTNTPTPTFTPSPTPTPSNTVLTLNLALSAIGNGVDQNPNPVHTQREFNIMIFDSANRKLPEKKVILQYDSTTATYKNDVNIGQIPSGNYLIEIVTNSYLVKLVPGIQAITAGTTFTVPPVTLIAGDINGDNKIDALDYQVYLSCFGSKAFSSDCHYRIQADLNDDGHNDTDINDSTYDKSDFKLLLQSFGRHGDEITNEITN